MKKLDVIRKLKKIKKLKLVGVIIIIVAFSVLHITPKRALRTHLFITGHPIIAFKTSITDDEFHNKINSKFLEVENAHCYTLTIPIIEKETDSYLANYIVRKKGFLYFADYYGEA
ncbi:hypothetical protein NPD5_1222 [Clostridium sporogenes]|uniref:Uncharacterized protein n=1 Tax=Clostridium sporogenes TaxID=1509 RepID=A0A1L3NAZ0_CLOSG|nr:hypothetical protein [Clostridium sporogenes]APH13269.1 hypothetical protein NPD5_1222 [Clostridium sporogenes]